MLHPEELLTLLYGVNRAVLKYGNAVLHQAGCPIQYLQLCLLKTINDLDQQRECSLYEIARKLKVDNSTLSHNSSKLQRDGYVIKKPGESSARRTILTLSETGKQVLEQYGETYKQINLNAAKGLGESFEKELKRIEQNVL